MRMMLNGNKGTGLLEMMIVLLISAIILSVIFRYAYFLEKSLNMASKKIDAIEKYHVVFAWMVRDVEMAGYLGCVNASNRKAISDPGRYLFSSWWNINNNSLQSQYMSPQQYELLENANNQLLIDGENHLKAEDVVVIENCWQAEVNKIKKISSVNYGTKNRLSFYYPVMISGVQGLFIARLIQHKYYIKDDQSLYVADINVRDEEVLANVNHLKLSQSPSTLNITLNNTENNTEMFFVARMYNAQ